MERRESSGSLKKRQCTVQMYLFAARTHISTHLLPLLQNQNMITIDGELKAIKHIKLSFNPTQLRSWKKIKISVFVWAVRESVS